MSEFEIYKLKRDYNLGLIKEENMTKEQVVALRNKLIKEANNYFIEYNNLKRKYELLRIKETQNKA
ncbi:MAG: hypothetical protein IKI57_02915 [Clostridia bacterium]|nr:hypothetical protein [Clostridia bacterium]